MRGFVPAYDLVTPRNLDEVLSLLAEDWERWQPIAGGTDMMVLFEAGRLDPKNLVSIWGLPELSGIDASPAHVTLGALTTYSQVRRHSLLQQEFPLLGLAASWTGGIATQNRGTLGGNIVNASPAADTPPALLVYDAELELISRSGTRWVRYENFHLGYKTIVLRTDELLSRIRLPRSKAGWKQYSRKVGTRKAQAISKVCLAAAARMDGHSVEEIRIAVGSAAPTVIRCRAAEQSIQGQPITRESIQFAASALGKDISPIDDIRSTERYRRQVAANLLTEFLESLRS